MLRFANVVLYWYMSEFNMKKAAAAGLVIGLGVGGASLAANNASSPEASSPSANTAEAPELTPDVVKALIESHYDQAAVVGEIEVVQGTDLLDEAEKIVVDTLGQDVYKENKGHLYPFLRETSLYYTTQAGPHPGDIARVLQGDWDNNPENGHEYIVVVGSDGLTETGINQVPSPSQIEPAEDTQLETLDQ
jgi:hypothetical protein